MSTFAPVHNHTQYSALDGLSTPKEIAQRCQCIGCTAAGITDHGTVTGHLEFGRVMRAHDIKPIFGCELYHGVKTQFGKQERDQFHFVAGALTDEGLRNVWRMVDAASDAKNYRFVGRVNWDICERFSEGVFATSACIQGLVAQSALAAHGGDVPSHLLGVLDRYMEIYRDNFYIEIHTYPGEEHELLNNYLVSLARERGIPLIYATDAHFAGPEQYEIHDAYVAMQTGETILLPPEQRKMWHPKSLYIQSEEEIRASLAYLPQDAVDEALSNSAELASRCNADLPEVGRHIPTFVPKECPWHEKGLEETAALMFIRLTEEGLINRYGADPASVIWDRAAYEIETMLDAHLEHYFLQVWDLCEYANRNGITRGPGRGSAAGSIVAYALGITDIDPLRYDLIFERFWNPGRAKGFPDIDIDFPVSQRKKVRQYLMKRWGENKVRVIGTTTRMKPKAALDKTHKACGVTIEEKETLKVIINGVPDINIHDADTIGWSEDGDPGKTIYVMHSTPESQHDTGKRIIEWLESQPSHRQGALLRWLEVVEMVCSRVSGYGVHPSGVIVSDIDLPDYAPCMYNRKQEVQVTCFPMAEIDKLGLLKDDLLGLRNLDTLERWEALTGRKEDWHALAQQEHPEEMWKLLDAGLTTGFFQIERGYARQLCKQMKPRSIDDLGVIVAVNRPGPIRAGVPESYIRRKNGEEEVTYDHPILEPITNQTYGHLVYQEQIMRFFSAIGYSEGDADEIRKILGKKKPEVMKTVRSGEGEWAGKGYMKMATQAGIDETTAQLLWAKVEGFASYSFNKSHAIAYATVAFRTLYAKWQDPEQFIIACIQTNPDEAGQYVAEGRRMGVIISPPDIRRSSWDIYKAGEGEILFGFSNIKGIGKGMSQYIEELRDMYPEVMTPDDFLDALEREQELWQLAKSPFKSPSQCLPANKVDLLIRAQAFDNYIDREIALRDRQAEEKELLQVILTDDCEMVFAHYSDVLDDCDFYADLENPDVKRLDIPGVVATVIPKRTKRANKPMGIVTIEYQGDEAEFVVFPREWVSFSPLWRERQPGIFRLVKTDRGIHFDTGMLLSESTRST